MASVLNVLLRLVHVGKYETDIFDRMWELYLKESFSLRLPILVWESTCWC